jgi:hypothetical protein
LLATAVVLLPCSSDTLKRAHETGKKYQTEFASVQSARRGCKQGRLRGRAPAKKHGRMAPL